MLNTIFKAYDIRGTVPDQLNAEIAKNIGKAFVSFLQCKELIVGRDMRNSGEELCKAFMEGAVEMGASIVDVGQVCTDATYFASGFLKVPAVMFTASHNPPEYNGMKFSKAGAVPVNQDTGLRAMKEIIEKEQYKEIHEEKGTITEKDIVADYVNHVHSFLDKNKLKKLKIAVDAGNGMAGKMIPKVYESLPIDIVPLFFDLDGSFPNHLADPSKPENLKWLQDKVKEESCDLGMAFDGDADRIFFVDENGEGINSSLISALIAKNMLKKNPEGRIIHNLVCGHIVKDTVKKYGGEPIKERVGHSFIKDTMRKTNAVFAAEHSAHYYYRDNYNADSGIITSLILCEVISESGRKLSELLDEFRVYSTMPETSVKVDDKEKIMGKIKQKYSELHPKKSSDMDGITFEFDDWWFNVRPSNTEPLLRLNLEADNKELMEEKKEEIVGMLQA